MNVINEKHKHIISIYTHCLAHGPQRKRHPMIYGQFQYTHKRTHTHAHPVSPQPRPQHTHGASGSRIPPVESEERLWAPAQRLRAPEQCLWTAPVGFRPALVGSISSAPAVPRRIRAAISSATYCKCVHPCGKVLPSCT